MNQPLPRDGGPAYPWKEYGAVGYGQSLRDHYAGQVVPVVLKDWGEKMTGEKRSDSTLMKLTAKFSFLLAQAMVDEKYRLDALDAEAAKEKTDGK